VLGRGSLFDALAERRLWRRDLALLLSLNLGTDLRVFADSGRFVVRLFAPENVEAILNLQALNWVEEPPSWYYSLICAGEAN
jgi:hypothetical protein